MKWKIKNGAPAKPSYMFTERHKRITSTRCFFMILLAMSLGLLLLQSMSMMIITGSHNAEALREDSTAFWDKSRGFSQPEMKTIQAKDGLLPSATRLLTTKAPFEDNQAVKLSESLIESPNTIVTGYFRVPSKYHPGKYDAWMSNMLSLQDAMVIFTQNDVIDQVKELRSHAKNRTVIIPLEIEQLPFGTLYSKHFWQDQLDRDPEKKIHRSYELFWIWLSKSWLTTQAIRMNFFESDLYVWSDIGCFRNSNYNGKTMIQHREVVPPTEMIQMAHHRPNPPNENLYNDKYKQKSNFYHSGSQFAAYKATWARFHEYFLDIIDQFLQKDMIIVEDQAVLQSTCLSHPKICAYIPFTEVNDNHYFGLRYALHHGGNFKLWRYDRYGFRNATT